MIDSKRRIMNKDGVSDVQMVREMIAKVMIY